MRSLKTMKSIVLFIWMFLLISPIWANSGNDGPLLLLVNHADIQLIPVKNPNNSQTVTSRLIQAVACDYIYEEKLIFWMDAMDYGKGKIQCVNMSDPRHTKVDVIASGIEQPDGLACDWIGKKVYWTDAMTNRIEVSELNGTSRKVLIWGNLDQPRAIALDPFHAYLYWTDWGEVPKIERAGMDGTKREVLVKDNIYWPNGITIDYVESKVYWVEANYHFIHRMNLDGTQREEVINSDEIRKGYLPISNLVPPLSTIPPSTNHPMPPRNQKRDESEDQLKLSGALQHPSAITLLGEWIYWTDWATESIHSMLKNGTGLPVAVKEHDISPMDLLVYSQRRQEPGRNPCAQNNGGCSHLCLLSPDEPHYRCACPTGVQILPDKKNCQNGPNEILLLARRADLRVISLDTNDYSDVLIPVDNVRHAVAIEFDPVDEYVYWTDDGQRAILRAHLNGSGSEAIIKNSVEQSDGMAIDWIARNLYWTDTGRDYISVSRLNGTSRKVLIETEIEEPRAIVLDPVAGHMYWSDWGNKAKIERANLDGSDRLIFVDTDVKWPNGLALDHRNSLLFWADAKDDCIEMISLNGTGRKTVLSDEIPHIFGLSFLGDYLYWTDWQRRRIERLKIGDRHSRRILINQLPDIFGVKATSMSVLPGTNPCAINNGGCSHLCLYTPEGEKCHCPTGLELSSTLKNCIVPEAFLLLSFTKSGGIRRISLDTSRGDSLIPFSRRVDASFLDFSAADDRIYWTNSKNMTIYRSFLNGSMVKNFVSVGIEFLEGLAVDWIGRNVFWADSSRNRIEVAHMDKPSRRSVVWEDIESPRCLALDPANGFIYWSEWGREPRIKRANMDGSNVVQINKGKTGRVNSLTIDYQAQRLYWVDFDINVIVSSDMNGDQLIDVVKGGATQTISSLTLYDDYVYWSDSKRKSVIRTNKISGDKHITKSGLSDIDDIMVYHGSRQSGVTSCSHSSGGCQHLCLSMPEGSHVCSCPSHYHLNKDNVTCSEPLDFLLLSQTHYITRIIFLPPGSDVVVVPDGSKSRRNRALPGPDAVIPVRGIQDACSIDYDPIDGMVYWLDCKLGELRSSRPDSSEERLLLRNNDTRHQPFDFAVDVYNRLLYWTDSISNSIKVMRLDGRPVGTVLSSHMQVAGRKSVEILPRKIAVDPLRGRLYFSSTCRNTYSCRFKIIGAALDGSDGVILFKHDLHNVSALSVDEDTQRLYWADQTKIEWASLDGSFRTVLVDTGLKQPVGLAVFGEDIYWLDAQTDGGLVECANKFDGSNRRKIQSRMRNLRDIVSVREMTESALAKHPCSIDNGGCSHICLAMDNGSTSCSCPNHLALVGNFQCGEPSACDAHQFTCQREQQCIPEAWRCDGTTECTDKTDEFDCNTAEQQCEDKFSCGPLPSSMHNVDVLKSLLDVHPECIERELVCDGQKDCLNGNDEDNCHGAHMEQKTDNTAIIVIGIVCGCTVLLGVVLLFRYCVTHTGSRYPPGVVMFTHSNGQLNLNVEFQPHNDSNPVCTTVTGGRKKPSYFNLSIVPPNGANTAGSQAVTNRSGWPAGWSGQIAERPGIPGASNSSSVKRIPRHSYETPNDTCGGDHVCSSDSPSLRSSSYCGCKSGHKHRTHMKPSAGHGPPPPTPCTTDTCEDFEGRSYHPGYSGSVPYEPPPPYYCHPSCCRHCCHQFSDHRMTSSSGSMSSRRCGDACAERPLYGRHRSGRRRHYHRQFSCLNSDSDPYAPPPTPRSQYMSECCTTEVEDAPEVEEITSRINALSKEGDEETALLSSSRRSSPSITERSYSTPLYNPPPSPVTDSS